MANQKIEDAFGFSGPIETAMEVVGEMPIEEIYDILDSIPSLEWDEWTGLGDKLDELSNKIEEKIGNLGACENTEQQQVNVQ